MNQFIVTVRTGASSTTFPALAPSSSDAYADAADLFGDTPCGITVMPGRVS